MSIPIITNYIFIQTTLARVITQVDCWQPVFLSIFSLKENGTRHGRGTRPYHPLSQIITQDEPDTSESSGERGELWEVAGKKMLALIPT